MTAQCPLFPSLTLQCYTALTAFPHDMVALQRVAGAFETSDLGEQTALTAA